MNLTRLLLREVAHRKFNFTIGLLSITVAVGCGVAAVLLLAQQDRQSEQILHAGAQANEKEWSDSQRVLAKMAAESDEAWKKYKDDVRKESLNLGFNLLIIPQGTDYSSPESQAQTLPETYAEKLAGSNMVQINHVLPFLQQKFWWPERKRWITLVGTTGEVYIQDPKRQKPMLQKVAGGRAMLGYAIHQSLELKPGQSIEIAARKFDIETCIGRKNFADDEKIYVPLRTAQELLNKPGRISGLMAIDCDCDDQGLLLIRENVAKLLPGTRVVEQYTQHIARATNRAMVARNAVAAFEREKKVRMDMRDRAAAALENEKQTRADLRDKRLALAAVLIPLVVAVSGVWMGLMLWDNVRRRRSEIGILGALGVGRSRIMVLFLGKALLMGLLGSLVGYAAGLAVAAASGPLATSAATLAAMLGAAVGAAMVLALVASFVPAQLAAATDPATVIQEESL
ncbi:MAG: FtsX-like permease family protein [Planctomycetaceae bacterium]|nr:hypothetical protein [Planctomycetaceae bacterium]